MIRGLDVSHWQGDLDWSAIAAAPDIGFAIVKATQGTKFVDPRFHANVVAASGVGLKVGAYHFADLDNEPAAEMAHFASVVGVVQPMLALPPALDVESMRGLASFPTSTGAAEWVAEWLDAWASTYSVVPLLYCNLSILHKYLSTLRDRHLWLAKWSVQADPGTYEQGTVKVWQYTDGTATSPLAGHRVDLDRVVDENWYSPPVAAPDAAAAQAGEGHDAGMPSSPSPAFTPEVDREALGATLVLAEALELAAANVTKSLKEAMR